MAVKQADNLPAAADSCVRHGADDGIQSGAITTAGEHANFANRGLFRLRHVEPSTLRTSFPRFGSFVQQASAIICSGLGY